MMEYSITLPSKPRIVSEEEMEGVYEIDGLYPGYGHTLGNSLRRIILSSLPGAAITSVKIEEPQKVALRNALGRSANGDA
jgi:DNA-directed RNA polymerase subunit alpha